MGVNMIDINNIPEFMKSMAGSTDMGNVSYVKPSIHPIFKIGDAMNHTKEFTVLAGRPEAQLPTLNSGKAMMMTAIEVITDQSLMKSIKDEFDSTE